MCCATVCRGATLQSRNFSVKFKGNVGIAELLDTTVEEALPLLEEHAANYSRSYRAA